MVAVRDCAFCARVRGSAYSSTYEPTTDLLPMNALTRRQGSLIRRLHDRRSRRKEGLFLVEGQRCCEEAFIHAGKAVEFVVLAEGFEAPRSISAERIHRCSVAEFATVSTTQNAQGILAVMRYAYASELPSPEPYTLILDGVGDPGNMGTILRTAWACGLRSVCVTDGSCDPYSPKTIRAGMGAQFSLTLFKLQSVAEWQTRFPDGRLWLTDPHEGARCMDAAFDPRGGALVIGGEAHGVGDLPGARVTIPMPGQAESLNVAQATTILLYETLRRGWLPGT
ncbi:MAG TPA: RNA methyltransferase [Lentisphaeria bacterium]|nr:RNA methyltransferase [Lentisphaeria bacterium]